MKKFFLGLIMLVAISCNSGSPPSGIMDRDSMINFLVDLHLAEAKVKGARLSKDSADQVFEIYERKLFNDHNISESIFIESYNYYMNHSLLLEEIYTAVIDSVGLKQDIVLMEEEDAISK